MKADAVENVLDAFPYPWHVSAARELHVVLTQLYPSGKAAQFMAQKAALDAGMLNADQAPYVVWKELLDLAATGRKTRALVTLARDQHADNARAPFLAALLNNENPIRDAEPRGELGAPAFLSHDDSITEREALLFRDDLTLPIGRVPWLIRALEQVLAASSAVCRLEVSRNIHAQTGTAFRIGPNLLLTNWHVLTFSDEPASAVTAEFGYEDDGKGGGLASTAIECDAASIVGEKANDWAVVRAKGSLPATATTLNVAEAAEPIVNESAFVIQHPGGSRKRIAYVRNQVTAVTDAVVQYLSDTQTGSSGSPVLNDAGRLIAIHHAGGRPQELAGRMPLAKNEGIRLSAVVKGFEALGVKLQ